MCVCVFLPVLPGKTGSFQATGILVITCAHQKSCKTNLGLWVKGGFHHFFWMLDGSIALPKHFRQWKIGTMTALRRSEEQNAVSNESSDSLNSRIIKI